MSLLACILAALAVLLLGRPPPDRRLPGLRAPGLMAGGEVSPASAGTPAPPDRQRARSVLGQRAGPRVLSTRRGRIAVAVAAGAVAALLWGGWSGCLVGAGVGIVLARTLARMEPVELRRRRAALAASLPLVADLLAACLRAGGPPTTAVEAVARSVDGPLAAELAAVAAALRLGAEPQVAWEPFLREPALAGFGAAMARAWDSGASLSGSLERVARDARVRRRAAAEQRARAVGVRAAAPLGLCFLPAFLLIGVVPVIVGGVSALLR